MLPGVCRCRASPTPHPPSARLRAAGGWPPAEWLEPANMAVSSLQDTRPGLAHARVDSHRAPRDPRDDDARTPRGGETAERTRSRTPIFPRVRLGGDQTRSGEAERPNIGDADAEDHGAWLARAGTLGIDLSTNTRTDAALLDRQRTGRRQHSQPCTSNEEHPSRHPAEERSSRAGDRSRTGDIQLGNRAGGARDRYRSLELGATYRCSPLIASVRIDRV